jgi:uncharacterized membrane protein
VGGGRRDGRERDMSETVINALFAWFMVTLVVAGTVIIAMGTVWLVYSMVTGMMDEIREREERDEE